MTSHLEPPRTPRQSAEALIRRGRMMGDAEMIQRGRDCLRYAEEQEARADARRPSEIYEPSRFEHGGSFIEGAHVGGQLVGLFFVTLFIATIFVPFWTAVIFVLGLTFLSCAALGLYETIKRAQRTRR